MGRYDGEDIIDTSKDNQADLDRAERIANDSSYRSNPLKRKHSAGFFFKERLKKNYASGMDNFLGTTKDKINEYTAMLKKPTIEHDIDPKLLGLGLLALLLLAAKWLLGKK